MIRLYIIFCLAVILPSFSSAQTPSIGDKIEDEFNVTAIPDTWKNESAVIIGMKEEYLFKRQQLKGKTTAGINIKEYIHKRIKLQDKNAVEKFSTFYYVTIGHCKTVLLV